MEYTKKVLMCINVPIGNFCWDNKRICRHFDADGGALTCSLGFIGLKDKGNSKILKPDECRKLIRYDRIFFRP